MSTTIPTVCIIGITGFGNAHLKSLYALEADHVLKIGAATVINRPQAEADCTRLESLGCMIYSDYTEMLRQERGRCELCIIPTGIPWHCPMTVAALEAGYHVYVEKPAAALLGDVDTMIAARDRAGKHVYVGFQDLFMDITRTVKQRILDGEIGELKEVRVSASWPRPYTYYQRNDWAGKIRIGATSIYDSPANNAFSHYLMAAFYFAGTEIDGIAEYESFEAELFRVQSIESFDTISTRIRTKSGVNILYTVSLSGGEVLGPYMNFYGSRGSIRWRIDSGYRFEKTGEFLETRAPEAVREDAYRKVLATFRTPLAIGCRLEMAREHTRFINDLHASIPIQDVHLEYTAEVDSSRGMMRAVPGMHEAIVRSQEQNCLLSELGLPWTMGQRISEKV